MEQRGRVCCSVEGRSRAWKSVEERGRVQEECEMEHEGCREGVRGRVSDVMFCA